VAVLRPIWVICHRYGIARPERYRSPGAFPLVPTFPRCPQALITPRRPLHPSGRPRRIEPCDCPSRGKSLISGLRREESVTAISFRVDQLEDEGTTDHLLPVENGLGPLDVFDADLASAGQMAAHGAVGQASGTTDRLLPVDNRLGPLDVLDADLAAQRQAQQIGDRFEVTSAGQMAAHGASLARLVCEK
jgi:hypothetical protein